MTEKKRWTLVEFLDGFVKGTLGRKSKHNSLSIRKNDAGLEVMTSFSFGRQDDIAVRMPDGSVIYNTSRMKGYGKHMAWGNLSGGWNQTKAQIQFEKMGLAGLPFDNLKEAGGIGQIKILDKGQPVMTNRWVPVQSYQIPSAIKSHPGLTSNDGLDPDQKDARLFELDSTVGRTDDNGVKYRNLGTPKNSDWRRQEKVHFSGAILFSIGESFFLFDADQEELKHDIFNPFIVKLKNPAMTIAEAYQGLIPDDVKVAIENGLKVERQGEWFFVPDTYIEDAKPATIELTAPPMPPKSVIDKCLEKRETYIPGDYLDMWRLLGSEDAPEEITNFAKSVEEWRDKIKTAFEAHRRSVPNEGRLRQGNNRPNNVEKFVQQNGKTLVMGLVTHTGREHRPLMLTTWHRAIPNTSVESWQVSGDVD